MGVIAHDESRGRGGDALGAIGQQEVYRSASADRSRGGPFAVISSGLPTVPTFAPMPKRTTRATTTATAATAGTDCAPFASVAWPGFELLFEQAPPWVGDLEGDGAITRWADHRYVVVDLHRAPLPTVTPLYLGHLGPTVGRLLGLEQRTPGITAEVKLDPPFEALLDEILEGDLAPSVEAIPRRIWLIGPDSEAEVHGTTWRAPSTCGLALTESTIRAVALVSSPGDRGVCAHETAPGEPGRAAALSATTDERTKAAERSQQYVESIDVD